MMSSKLVRMVIILNQFIVSFKSFILKFIIYINVVLYIKIIVIENKSLFIKIISKFFNFFDEFKF